MTLIPVTPKQRSPLAPHLTRLAGNWALWRTVCLRGAGFPVGLLADLGAPALAGAADVFNSGTGDLGTARSAYVAEFAAEVRRQSRVLHQLSGQPLLREAVTWQNRHAVENGIDVLLTAPPADQPAQRTAQAAGGARRELPAALLRQERHHRLLRPRGLVPDRRQGWSPGHPRLCGRDDSRPRHLPGRLGCPRGPGPLSGGAAPMAGAEAEPAHQRVDGMTIRRPLGPPRLLTAAEAAVLRACDGIRDAIEVAATVLADPAAGLADVPQVFALMERMAHRHVLAWQFDVAPQDIRPERSARRYSLARVL